MHSLVINWYKTNLRDLPWRKNKDPYSIWLSEIILQQTQVIQGLPYYERFIKNFPTVKDLALAKEEDILKLWQGLGYYSRARNLHFAAKQIVTNYSSIFPNNYKELIKLKGIGDYTASAIASIAYGEVVPAIDGNALRVISRVFNIDLPVDKKDGKKAIKDLMIKIIDTKNPGDFNQAIMELGAMVCKPKNPNCNNCPLQEKCLSFEKENFLERPVKSRKTKVANIYIDYLILSSKEGIVMQQRDNKGIWKSLYEFPNITSNNKFEDFEHLRFLRTKFSLKDNEIQFVKELKHKLTHRNLYIRFFKCELQQSKGIKFMSADEVQKKAVPKPIENFLKEF